MNHLIIEHFNGIKIYNFVWDNRLCWIAVDIAKLLNYKEPSHSIRLCIERERFIENREYSLLKGEDLKKFKGIIGDDIADNVRYSSKLMIFYESGLYGFLQYSDKPVAITFKTWIRLQVIPQIRKNKGYILAEFECDKDKINNNESIMVTYKEELNCRKEKEGDMVFVNILDNLNKPNHVDTFDVDKFQRLRLATDSAKMLKALLDEVDTDSICKLAVVKAVFSESGINLPIYFNKK